MVSKSWRRFVLSSVTAVLLLLPAALQAAEPRVSHADAVARIAEPAQWLSRLWEGVTGLWQAATGMTTGQGDPGDSPTNDSGLTIDPDGKPGG
jgi:hypothetical protein